MAQLFANNAESSLAEGITAAATTITLPPGHGARFPDTSSGGFFKVTLTQPVEEVSREIVTCTARVGDVLTVARGQEGTQALPWGPGTAVSLRVTAGTLDDALTWNTGSRAAAGPITIAITGAWRYPHTTLRVPHLMTQLGDVVTENTGKWIYSFMYNEGNATAGDLLTSMTFTDLVGVLGSFAPSSMAALTTLSLPELTTVATLFNPSTMAALTTLNLPKLAFVQSSFIPSSMAALTTLSLPALQFIGGNLNPNTMAALTTLNLPALTTVMTAINANNLGALTSLSLPALQTIGGSFTPTNMPALTTISLPAIVTLGTGVTLTTATGALADVTLGSTLKSCGGNVNITSAALTQASVDGILAALASLDGTNGTTPFSSPRTVTLTGTSATPSAAGLASKATLVARGVIVTHN